MKNNIILTLLLSIICISNLLTNKGSFFSNSQYHGQDRLDEIKRIKEKNAQAKRLVENAVKHFMTVAVPRACYDFIYDPIWRKGELYVFVIDEKGINLAQGDDSELIWQDMSAIKVTDKLSLVKQMLKSKEGRVIGYEWDNSYITSYVKAIKKDGKKYVLGAGFFPQSSQYTAKVIAKSAAAYFYSHDKDDTFSLISQYGGPFSRGNISTFVFDTSGVLVADSVNSALINQNLYDTVDAKGKHYIKEMIELAKKDKGRGWYSHYWSNTLQDIYFIQVTDPKSKNSYIIASGYYPNETFQSAKSFVSKAVSYLKTHGAKRAFLEFTNKIGQFIKGSLYIAVYDMNGKCVANGFETGIVGQNVLKRVDQHGKYYIQEMLRVAKKYKRGIAAYYIRNAFTLAYVYEVSIPEGRFIVCCEYVPDSKVQAVEGFVNKGLDYLQNNNEFDAFSRFSSKRGGFLQGDLYMFVYNSKGIRLVNGFHKGQVWRNFLKTTDQNGKAIIQDIITLALNGGGWYGYRSLNAQRRIFVKAIEKNEHTFIVGSGYFL